MVESSLDGNVKKCLLFAFLFVGLVDCSPVSGTYYKDPRNEPESTIWIVPRQMTPEESEACVRMCHPMATGGCFNEWRTGALYVACYNNDNFSLDLKVVRHGITR